MIIIEGLDNTGKTTLAEALMKKLRFPIYRLSFPKNSEDEVLEHSQEINNIQKMIQPRHLIVDRHPVISEYVYGIIRGTNYSSLQAVPKWMDLMQRLHLPTMLYIYCNRPIGEILNSFDSRSQMEGVKNRVGELLIRYDTVNAIVMSNQRPVRFLYYNFQNMKETTHIVGELCRA